MGLRDARRRAAAAVARRLGDPWRVLRFVENQDRGAVPDPSRLPLDLRALRHGALASVKPDASISGRHHIVAEALGHSEMLLVPLAAFASAADYPLRGDRLQALDEDGTPLLGEPLLQVETAEPDRTEQLVLRLSRVPGTPA